MGAFGDLGTHALDLMLWMLGDVDRVTAALQVAIEKYGSACDETGEALFYFSSGAIGTLGAAWVDVAEPVTAEISGTEGHAYVHNRSDLYVTCANLEGADGRSPWTRLPPAWPHAFDLFLDALNDQDRARRASIPPGRRRRGGLPQRGHGGDVPGRGRGGPGCHCSRTLHSAAKRKGGAPQWERRIRPLPS